MKPVEYIILGMTLLLMQHVPHAEIQYMESAVEAEAGVCNYVEKQYVASCILNRVNSDEWGDSITDVIQQPGQFQVYSNKRIDTVKVTNQSRVAVLTTLINGSIFDAHSFCNYELISQSNKDYFDSLELVAVGYYMRYYK